MLRGNTRGKGEGFSLVELLITVVILSILAAIAIPIYMNQKSKSSASTASADARAATNEITSLLSRYSNLGSSGTISIAGTTLTVAMSAPTPTGNATGTARLTSGTSLFGSTVPGAVGAAGPRFCISVTNNGQTVIANETGVKTATSCVNGIAS